MKKIDSVKTKAMLERFLQQLIVSGSAIVIALVLGMVLIALMDINPLKAFAALLEGAGAGDGSEIVRESAYLRVRKLLYHIDRAESQDGSRVCSGWAFAKTWDGRCLPVNIRVAAPGGEQFAAEITRRARADVAEMFKLRRVENPEFGFDCVWQAAPEQRFCIYFSLGNRESIYEG